MCCDPGDVGVHRKLSFKGDYSFRMDFPLVEKIAVESLGLEFAVGWRFIDVDRLTVGWTVVELEAYDRGACCDVVEELLAMVKVPSSLILVALHGFMC